jgi:hypothetical protein
LAAGRRGDIDGGGIPFIHTRATQTGAAGEEARRRLVFFDRRLNADHSETDSFERPTTTPEEHPREMISHGFCLRGGFGSESA